MAEKGIALVVGAGPGLGASVARRFAKDGMAVAVVRRNTDDLKPLVKEIEGLGVKARAYACDATDARSVDALFESVRKDLGVPDVVVYNAGIFEPKSFLEITPEQLENNWRILCLGAFLVGKAAARLMVERGSGSILFTGATAGMRAGARFANLAVGKFGLRALSQCMAREFGPKGVHVAHIVNDGVFDTERIRKMFPDYPVDNMMNTDEIAEAYYMLHRQPRSAWTQELDLRPAWEKF